MTSLVIAVFKLCWAVRAYVFSETFAEKVKFEGPGGERFRKEANTFDGYDDAKTTRLSTKKLKGEKTKLPIDWTGVSMSLFLS